MAQYAKRIGLGVAGLVCTYSLDLNPPVPTRAMQIGHNEGHAVRSGKRWTGTNDPGTAIEVYDTQWDAEVPPGMW
ncbi:unnamed protein product [Clonostachys rhizophaga]|uniref:Uncharacterized protein n=1 Tax=Clonostachys rhizophaga TaxID=160324 RepID=A0A9N9VKW4_9HYPO|nr:unnamed protein product [Clonostachys rhizophaga]